MLRLILVRHAETDWNRLRRIQGTSDIPLNTTGQEQAKLVGLYLKQDHFDSIFSSPLGRATETAAEIARHHSVNVVTAAELHEIGYGVWEGLSYEEIPSLWPKEWAAFRLDPARNRPPGGERLEDNLVRMQSYIDGLRHARDGESICLIGHSGTVRSILTNALCGTPDTWIRLSVWNASVSEVLFNDNGRAEILRVNDHSFLEAQEKLPY